MSYIVNQAANNRFSFAYFATLNGLKQPKVNSIGVSYQILSILLLLVFNLIWKIIANTKQQKFKTKIFII